MPSPFPGMDPFIEGQRWHGFQTQFVPALGQALVPMLRPRYQVDFQDYVYLTSETDDDDEERIGPDVWVAEADGSAESGRYSSGTAAVATPVILTIRLPRRARQPYLVIRTKDGRNVVAVVEVLSPWNKSPGAGRHQYLGKRENVLRSGTHLVELDLLRGGERLPTREQLPAGEYFAFVSRSKSRPKVATYPWSLRSRMPVIGIPLTEGDDDVPLDLQAVFDETYDRAGYDYSLDYGRDVEPPLSEGDASWVRTTLERRGS